jgi:hypothetical protein
MPLTAQVHTEYHRRLDADQRVLDLCGVRCPALPTPRTFNVLNRQTDVCASPARTATVEDARLGAGMSPDHGLYLGRP